MEYIDEEILEARRELELMKHNTLETGIYVEDELITFTKIILPDTKISIFLPEQFIVMPDMVKDMKYPSKNAPDLVVTSLDSKVNFGFNILPVLMEAGDTEELSRQFQNAIHNVNPSIRIKNQTSGETMEQGNEMSWFDFKGYTLDELNYNRMYLVRMRKTVLHGVFNCPMRVKEQWESRIVPCRY